MKSHTKYSLLLTNHNKDSTHVIAGSPSAQFLPYMLSLLPFLLKSLPVAGAWDSFASCPVYCVGFLVGTGSGPLIKIVKASFLGDKIMFEKYSVVHWGQEGKMKEGRRGT